MARTICRNLFFLVLMMMRIPDSKSFAPTLFHHDNSMCSHRHRRHTVNTMATDPIKIYWLPLSIGCDREERTDIQEHAVDYLAEKICQILPNRHNNVTIETAPDDAESPSMIVDTPEGVEEGSQIIGSIAKGRFVDMTCSKPAENLLESLFVASPEYNPDVIEGAIIAMQSLLVFGMQVGIKGPPETLQRLVQHLRYMGIDDTDDEFLSIGLASRRLKFNRDHTAAIEVLAKLKWKRTSQGAFGLLVKMGVWSVHEDLALLRSGFPTGFVQKEEEAAKEATDFSVDQDSLLGIRKDLRSLKVYTIDGESTKEVDDGLSVERIESDDGSVRHRFWVFISDADRWAGRTSRLFKVASRRATTLYQPTKTYYMFPESVAFEHMSLKSNQDSCALSMSLELLPSGEIDVSSIDVMTSTINVDYRLTYDDVDEMLDEGVGYSEEWQLGALLDAAKTRRQYRCNSGSIEGLVDQIPRSVISTNPDPSAEDGVDISVDLEVSHNAGKNMTTVTTDTSLNGSSLPPPASSANLLVTEMMIMAGEAMGKWAIRELQSSGDEMMLFTATQNFLQLEVPYRSQPAPAFRTRELEANRFWALKENNDGNGYCASWYIRRFLEPVSVDKEPKPHACMGLECYVQWTSPIRRFSDLQTHAAVKRFIRAKRLNKLVWDKAPLPAGLILEEVDGSDVIDLKKGIALQKTSRRTQNESERYWMYEYIKRRLENTREDIGFESVVLGCLETKKLLYVVYLHEIGLETKYVSQKGELEVGETIWLKCQSVNPRMGLIRWTLSSKTSGYVAAAA